MSNPFEAKDFQDIKSYVEGRSPEQMAAESEIWDGTAADNLARADLLARAIGADEHAIALYQRTLGKIDADPDRAYNATNVVAAYASLGDLLAKRGRHDEAVDAFEKARKEGGDDPDLLTSLAHNLCACGKLNEAQRTLDSLFRRPNRKLFEEMSEERITIAVELREFLRARLSPTLGRLEWYSLGASKGIPKCITELELSALVESGVTSEVVNAIKSAVVTKVSPDETMWFVSFFAVVDPIPLAREGRGGGVAICFYVNLRNGFLRGYSVQ